MNEKDKNYKKAYKEALNAFLSRIEKVRNKISGIYFYGSRARGTYRPDSDYDLLVLVPHKDPEVKDKLFEAAVDVLIEKGADISLKIIKTEDFDKMKKISLPFVENILREGKKIG